MTMSAIDAAARLQTRLENHNELIQIAERGARKVVSSGGKVACVVSTDDWLVVRLLSCTDMRCSTARVASVGEG